MNQHSVLIVSDDTDFARTVTARWQTERYVPGITVVASDVWHRARPEGYALVIVGPLEGTLAGRVLASLSPGSSCICVSADQNSAALLRAEFPQVIVVPKEDAWINTLILVAGETLRMRESVARAQRAERIASNCRSHALLGQYMLEMRHSVNNALTSILGNADLLLIEPGQLSAESREQIKTIHAMALRLNEIMQRFSSLASEMKISETSSQSEKSLVPQTFVQ